MPSADPTRTQTVRKRFGSVLRGALRSFATKLRRAIRTDDIIGLDGRADGLQGALDPVANFGDWIDQEFASSFTGIPEVRVASMIERAYKRGLIHAHTQATGVLAAASTDNLLKQSQFTRNVLNGQIARQEITRLRTRVDEALLRNQAEVRAAGTRLASNALSAGMTTREFLKEMRPVIEKAQQRMRLIAETETIRSHADAQVTGFEALGVNELTVEAEWRTVGDNRVCASCEANESQTFSIEEARNLIPLHPGCRCSWVLVKK